MKGNRNRGIYIVGLTGLLLGILIGLMSSKVITNKAINQHIENTQAEYNRKKSELIQKELEHKQMQQ